MILAIDTSSRRMGVALYNGSQVVIEMAWTSNFHHTMELAPTIVQAIARADVRIGDVEALAVALGPGSFTSLRTGLAFAKGIALARYLPLVGIPTLDFLAAAQPINDLPMAAVLEAGRKRLAVGWYKAIDSTWQQNDIMEILSPQDLAKRIHRPTLICGELSANARKILQRKWKNARLPSPALSQRRPAFLAELAWERWQADQVDDPATLAPIYLSQGEKAGGDKS